MKNDITKNTILSCIECYANGRYSVSDCLEMINKAIYRDTWIIPDVDTRISKQNKLYIFGLDRLTKAIRKMQRMHN